MAEPTSISGFFEAEWQRFWDGWDKLSPEQQQRELDNRAKSRARSGQLNTVSLPGWDDVIHLAPRYQPTAAERTEYYAARREQRTAQLTAEAVTAIETRRATAQRIASSTAPPYAQAFGQMLTALDNVQDFTTTVATLGRLALWPAIRALDSALPRFAAAGWAQSTFGATPAAAEALASAAARSAASEAYLAQRALSLAEYAAAARAGLERSSLLAAGREAAEAAAAAAAREAYRRTLAGAVKGIGSRVLGRLIPGLGWILLVGDLINLLSWLGNAGMVGYSAVCFGPGKGLAAAGPIALLRGKGALGPCGTKGKITQLGDLNPFSQAGRATRQMRLGRAMPGIGPLLETAQTTDQLYGVGLSFGGIVGAITEGAYAAELNSRGQPVNLLPPASALGTAGVVTGAVALQVRSKSLGALAAGSLLADIVGRTATAPLREKHKAAQQLQNAPAINGTQETFTEYEHIEQLVNYTHALDLVSSDLAGLPWQEWIAAHMPFELSPPEYLDPLTLAIIRERDPHLTSLGRWPLDGAPHSIASTPYVEAFSKLVPSGLRDFLEPRRSSAVGMFAGGVYNHITERLWAMLEPEPGFLRMRWEPDFRLLIALGETARLVDVNAPPENLWRFWETGRELAEQKALQEITGEALDTLAEQADVQLIHIEEPFLRLPLQ